MPQTNIPPLQQARLTAKIEIPHLLSRLKELQLKKVASATKNELESLFPHTKALEPISFEIGQASDSSSCPLKVGVVLSGGQAPGGHNVITGLWDALQQLNLQSQLIGFLNGPGGLIKNEFRQLTSEVLDPYRNQGGFDLIGSGRTKLETAEQLQAAARTVKEHQLNGLVIIGGDDSNTNAALLAEFFLAQNIKTSVIGVPKTIDGDLKNEFIEASFGFDTATKIYSEIIGNIARDALSAKKYIHFIKIMGRSASHVALECALQTHPNYTAISEEVLAHKKSLKQITEEISDVISKRAAEGKNYGVIVIPEGLLEFIPECKKLIQELNILLAPESNERKQFEQYGKAAAALEFVQSKLSPVAKECFSVLPVEIQWQLLQDRDPHGNVQVSKIETEKLLIETVKAELRRREQKGLYKGKFDPQAHFLGYEGRAGYPSEFDCRYCYALGQTAALLIAHQLTGYMSCISGLAGAVAEWQPKGVPLVHMIALEERHGSAKPVISKALVELDGKPFQTFNSCRESWISNDDYRYPGPIQFFGPAEITDATTLTLALERSN